LRASDDADAACADAGAASDDTDAARAGYGARNASGLARTV
jgi:hypothetical protein